MKILLFGKTGQIGREIDMLAKNSKHEIVSYSRDEVDVAAYEVVNEAIKKHKPDCVINASGYHMVADCEKNPDKAFEINTYALKNLAVACKLVNARLINFSTDKVFDGKKRTAYREEDRPNPIQVYGMSKLAGELAAHNYYEDCITIRTCGVYGGFTGSRVKKGNFVLYILNEAKTKKTLEISVEQTASFVNANDLARAILKLLELKAEKGIYHIVNTGYDSWANFAKEIVKLSNVKLEIIPVDRSGVYSEIKIPLFAGLDNSKAKNLGIELSPWQDGLKRYLKFLSQVKS